MLWFQGTVTEAIGEAKSRKAVFVVYIHGDDEQSTNMSNTFMVPEVCTNLENGNYVTVKIEANSEICRQFSQIYPVVLIPSTYFIGDNGVPLEIIGGFLTPEDFLTKIKNISEAEKTEAPIATPKISEVGKPDEKQVDSQKSKENKKPEETKKPKETKKAEETKKTFSPKSDGVSKQPANKILKEAAETTGKVKCEEAASSSKDTAGLPKAGKGVNKIKVEDTLEGSKSQPAVKQPSSQESNSTRLQFRLPDGTSLTHQFTADDTLETVQQYLIENTNPQLRNFRLSTPFPRREYEASDYSQSLRDLQLTPCAVVLVMPAQRSLTASSSGITDFVWMILGPIVGFFNYLRTTLFGSAERSNSGTNYQSDRPPTAVRRKPDSKSSTFTKKDGNIHRMVNKDDDDENNTWNGNSTQQM